MAPSRAVSQSIWLKVDPKNDDFAVGYDSDACTTFLSREYG